MPFCRDRPQGRQVASEPSNAPMQLCASVSWHQSSGISARQRQLSLQGQTGWVLFMGGVSSPPQNPEDGLTPDHQAVTG